MSASTLTVSRMVAVEIDVADVLRSAGDDALRAEVARRGLVAIDDAPALAGADVRGARGLLDWTLHRLAAESGVSVSTLKRMEDDEASIKPISAGAIRRALEAGGVSFRAVDGATCLVRRGPGQFGTGTTLGEVTAR